jgi:hypothetical protein
MKTLSESIRDTMNKLEEAQVSIHDEKGLDISTMINRLESNPAFKSFFNGSQVVDDNGHPLICYHGSATGYKDVLYGLSHFGPFNMAKKFTSSAYFGKSDVVGAYFLNIKNPLEMEDVGLHTLMNYMFTFKNMNILNISDMSRILTQAVSLAHKYDPSQFVFKDLTLEFLQHLLEPDEDYELSDEENAFVELIDNQDENPSTEIEYEMIGLLIPFLKSKGIDGYKYINKWEEGAKEEEFCWVPLESYQIAPVDRFIK